MSVVKVNLGCGRRYHPAWINIDLAAAGPGVIEHNLLEGIPQPDASVDVLYHAHVVEHFKKEPAETFLEECFRVLKPGGLLRVAVPDLEPICRNYLSTLQAAAAGDLSAEHDYDWCMLELLDQLLRDRPGGEIAQYLKQETLPNEAFVFSRTGDEARELRELLTRPKPSTAKRPPPMTLRAKLKDRIRNLVLSADDWEALRIGHFRQCGAIHQWMYDRFSLGRLLCQCGFVEPVVCSALESGIPDWAEEHLDSNDEGRPYKPDSLYMEARRPKA